MSFRFNPLTGNFDIAGSSSGGGGAVDSVNGETGTVVLDAADVGADPAGTAQTLFDTLGNKYVRTTRFESIGSGTSGTVTLPSNSEVVLDDFGGTVDAILSTISSGKPTYQAAKTAANEVIATTFDSSGNWVLTGTPSAFPVAIIYRVRQHFADFDSTSSNIIGIPTIDVQGTLYFTESRSIATPNATVPAHRYIASGTETNIDVVIAPKGTGAILAQIPDNTTTGGNKRGTGAVDLQLSRTANTQVASGTDSFTAGTRNTAGSNATAIGLNNLASGSQSVGIGSNNTASAIGSVAIGMSNSVTGANAVALGSGADTNGISGRLSFSGGATTVNSQISFWDLKAATTNATPQVMLTAATANTSTRLLVKNSSIMAFKGTLVAKQTNSVNVAVWAIDGVVVRTSGGGTVFVGTPTVTAITNVPGWTTPVISIDSPNNAIAITVTGVAATVIHFSCGLQTTDLTV